jgi:trehalose 6-phosphate synthase/phosphatase
MGDDGGAEGHQFRPSTPPDPVLPTSAIVNTNATELPSTAPQPNTATPSTPQWNPRYVENGESSRNAPPTSPREAVSGASSPEELLRRLSLTESRPKHTKHAPPKSRKRYPGLELSGNVISATFCVPYKIDHGSDGEWVRFGVCECNISQLTI